MDALPRFSIPQAKDAGWTIIGPDTEWGSGGYTCLVQRRLDRREDGKPHDVLTSYYWRTTRAAALHAALRFVTLWETPGANWAMGVK